MEIPKEWTFKSKEVADNFNNHVREQLPWYDLATGLVAHIVKNYVPNNGIIYDIGASTGNIEISIQEIINNRKIEFYAIDDSDEMKKNYQGQAKLIIQDGCDVEYKYFDCAILFLTLQFIDITKREVLINNLIKKCKKGGCIIVFDKITIDSGYISNVLRRATIMAKYASGVSPDEIIKKELSISGVQRPLESNFFNFFSTAKATEIFRFGEFAGYVIEKKYND
jgi:tRNA (cmo5U34)-methyltransferase